MSGALPPSSGGRFEEIEQDLPSSTTQEPSLAIPSSSAGTCLRPIFFLKLPVDKYELHEAIFCITKHYSGSRRALDVLDLAMNFTYLAWVLRFLHQIQFESNTSIRRLPEDYDSYAPSVLAASRQLLS